ncbi:hypothetical protein SESBI_44887 [Sesbania bispinosa]|nr:hypothetical protein SESBI_44887 [Sesbania bispinosa]
MTNTSKSKGKTPLRSARKRARRSKPEAAESRGSFDGEVIHTHTLTMKNKPQIVEISSMDTVPHINERMENEDGLNNVTNDCIPENNPLENRVGKMENKLDRVVDTIDMLAKIFVGSKSNFESPNKMVPTFRKDSLVEEIDRTPKDEVFCSPSSAKSRGMVLVTTATPSGYYLNSRINEQVNDKGTLIGEFVPQSLKDMFKPRKTMALSKVEAAVASYIFCNSMTEEIDRKEVIVRTTMEYCEGQRILFHCLKPNAEIEQDVFIPMNDDNYHRYLVVVDFVNKEALYMEHLLLHPNFYRVEPLEKPQISKWPIYEPEGISRQNAES